MNRWLAQIGIPGIVGVIDGKHIEIHKPCKHGAAYFNRKSCYSLNVQGTSLRFIANFSHGGRQEAHCGPRNGSVGDGRIWGCSILKKLYKAWLSPLPAASLPTSMLPNGEEVYEEVPPFILADCAYSNTRNMVTTYKTSEILSGPIVRELNRKLGGPRYHVENALGS